MIKGPPPWINRKHGRVSIINVIHHLFIFITQRPDTIIPVVAEANTQTRGICLCGISVQNSEVTQIGYTGDRVHIPLQVNNNTVELKLGNQLIDSYQPHS